MNYPEIYNSFTKTGAFDISGLSYNRINTTSTGYFSNQNELLNKATFGKEEYYKFISCSKLGMSHYIMIDICWIILSMLFVLVSWVFTILNKKYEYGGEGQPLLFL